MWSLIPAVALAFLAATATASFNGNLNYASPSRRHARLGIDVPLVQRRSWKRDNKAYSPSELSFTHGIASGDPYHDSVILWTRIAPTEESDKSNVVVEGDVALFSHETEKYIEADANPICVDWKVYEEEGGKAGKKVASKGRAYTTSDIDYTLKVEAGGLKPFTTYYYQFTVCGSENRSEMGRTKTSPQECDCVDEIKLAVFSCASYWSGYFNVYGNAARKDDHDYLVHLGDYIYEYSGGGKRAHKPNNITFTLHDYRTRHGQYRTDPDLQILSQNAAWIATWDDHEISNNGYRDGSSDLQNTEESFLKDGPRVSVDARKMNAVRAYFEWMPIRQVDLDDNLRIWRSFKMGQLMDLVVLDTRNYDRSIPTLVGNHKYIDAIRDDPGRTLMGSRQENWFYKSLSQSKKRGATWRVVANQIIFSRVFENDKGDMSGDDWNGYIANRNRTLKHLYENKIGNNIFLAGDSHQNWVSDLAWLGTKDYDPKTGKGAIGVEFAGTAVSSMNLDATKIEPSGGDYSRGMIKRNDEMMWQEAYYRGYFLLKVTPKKATAQFFGSPSLATRNAWDIPLANFTVKVNENHLARPVGGGRAESGALKFGEVVHTNLTMNTETGEWDVVGFEKMYV